MPPKSSSGGARATAPTGLLTGAPTGAPSEVGTERKRRPRKRGGRRENFDTYIYRVLKQVHPDTGITKRAMAIMNSFTTNMFERIGEEADQLRREAGRATLSQRDVQFAVRIVLPAELAKHAASEGIKATTKFVSSKS